MLALVVHDYDEAIHYYCQTLGFQLVEDSDLGGGKRWVVVSPGSDGGAMLLLAKAATPVQSAAVGNQAGGRVFLFLHTGSFDADYARMKAAGVDFIEQPRAEVYGKVVVFRDIYGNKWDMIGKPG